MADEQRDDDAQETKVTNKVVDQGDTAESPAVAPEGATPGGPGHWSSGQSAPSGGQSPLDAQRRAEQNQDPFAEKPHLYVAGAFVGGLVFAQVLKLLGGGDDD